MRRVVSSAIAVATGVALTAGLLVSAAPSQAAPQTITIWADAAHAPVISSMLKDGYQGAKVTVVTKEMAQIRDGLRTEPLETAPDVIWGEQAWSGWMADERLILPITIDKKRAKKFRDSLLYGYTRYQKTYGVPVQFSNVAMITNVKLVPAQPATFDELASTVAALKKKGKGKKGFAVGQSPTGDGYAMYPLFAGLGGYIFGKDTTGTWDPSDVGLANPKFLKNSTKIDDWNAAGLIDSAMTADDARKAFVNGKAPFWIAGPEEMATLKALKFVYRITAVPPVVSGLKTGPLLRTEGFSVTRAAKKHGVDTLASDLVTTFFTAAPKQKALAGAAGLMPANTAALAKVAEPRLKAIAQAGIDGTPIPNLLQTDAVWEPMGTAWLKSTAGAGATKAKKAFTKAAGQVNDAIA